MTKVTIDRELLERAASMELDTTARSIRIQDELRAILARPPQQGEGLDVVGWVDDIGTSIVNKNGKPAVCNEPFVDDDLVRLSDAQRAISELRAESEQIGRALYDRNNELSACEAERDALRQQCDKLTQALEDVDREHDLIRQMKNCEIHRGRGSFGIAVMSDTLALEWQALDKELQQLIDARHAALAEANRA